MRVLHIRVVVPFLGRVVDAARGEYVAVAEDRLAVELAQDREQRAPVAVVRDAPAVVAFARQVLDRLELHLLWSGYQAFNVQSQDGGQEMVSESPEPTGGENVGSSIGQPPLNR